jgi:hypothetical protein
MCTGTVMFVFFQESANNRVAVTNADLVIVANFEIGERPPPAEIEGWAVCFLNFNYISRKN